MTARETRSSKRSKRTNIQAQDSISLSKQTSISISTSNLTSNVNSTGLPIFPDELLYEIFSHFPPSPLDADGQVVDPEAHAARRETLLALSQTCRSLRRFFKPYVWERIEVLVGMFVHGSTTQRLEPIHRNGVGTQMLAVELLRQLVIVSVQDPDLAVDVRVVNIVISNHFIEIVLQTLVLCLERFPNLHTIILRTHGWQWGIHYDDHNYARSACNKAFVGFTLPSVKSLTIVDSASALFSCCPNLQSIGWFKEDPTILEYVPYPLQMQLQRCITPVDFPALVVKEPKNWRSGRRPYTAPLARFKNLREVTIRLWAGANLGGAYDFIDEVTDTFRNLSTLNVQVMTIPNEDWEWLPGPEDTPLHSRNNPQFRFPRPEDPAEDQEAISWESHLEMLMSRAEECLLTRSRFTGGHKMVCFTKWGSLMEILEKRTKVFRG